MHAHGQNFELAIYNTRPHVYGTRHTTSERRSAVAALTPLPRRRTMAYASRAPTAATAPPASSASPVPEEETASASSSPTTMASTRAALACLAAAR